MRQAGNDEILAVLEATALRRLIAVAIIAALGLILLWVALAQPPVHLGWRLFLLVFGGVALWGAERLRQATRARLELTRTELRDSTGTTLARLEDIASLDRGVFAFKPSNGFILRLKAPQSREWRPGLWWRTGRRVGVGGVTPGSQARFMAETIQGLLAAREQD